MDSALEPPPGPSTRGRRARGFSGDDRERAILATAERLLGERPLSEISVDQLAKGAGISRPTFYFYFTSKEQVLLALFDRVVEEARSNRGDALQRLADDEEQGWRDAIGP
ncbi:MAG: helix-turn-helix transcriptional regulator, partial [Streptomyces sp.]|nr:helix-turn-helix transcriptional regulator [Streptomyces sp.]